MLRYNNIPGIYRSSRLIYSLVYSFTRVPAYAVFEAMDAVLRPPNGVCIVYIVDYY